MTSFINQLNFSERQQRLLVTLLLLPLVTFFRFFEGIPEYANFQLEGKIALVLTGGAVLLGWIASKWIRDRKTLQSKLNYLFVLVFSIVLIKLSLSGLRSLSVEYSLLLIGYCLTFYLLADLRRSELVWESFISALLIVTGLSLFYIAKDLVYWTDLYMEVFPPNTGGILHWYSFLPRFSGSYGPNVLAVNLVLVLPLGLYRTVKTKNIFGRLIYGLFAALCVAAIVFTKSRGGIIGTGAAVGLFGMLLWRSIFPWSRNKAIFLMGVMVGLCLLAALIGFVFASRGGLNSIIPEARLDAWRITRRLIASRPILGIDLGTYGQEFINHRMGSETTIIHLHPHNEALTAAVYFGLPGIVLTGLALAAIGAMGVQVVRRLDIESLSNFALIGLAGYAVHGMVDSFLNVYQVGALVLFLIVSLTGSSQRINPVYRTDMLRLIWLTTMVGLIGAGALFQIWRLAPYENARKAAERGDLKGAEGWIDTALARDHQNAYYHHAKAVIVGKQAISEGSAFDRAEAQFARSIADYPGWAPDRYNYAVLLSAHGRHVEAFQELKAAADKFPDISFYHCAAAEELEFIGWVEGAVKYYGRCLALIPGSQGQLYWDGSEVRQEHFSQIKDRAEAYLQARGKGSEKYLLRFFHHLGIQEQYNSLADSLPASAEFTNQKLALQGSEHLDAGDWQLARSAFLEMLNDHPRNKTAWDGLAESYLESGQEEKFEQAVNVSLALGGSSRTYTLLGLHHERASRPEEAIDAYQMALIVFTYPHRERKLATWTARRYPFPITWIDKLPSLHSEYGYQLALERYSELIAGKSCQEQLNSHRQIIWNTTNPSVISLLVGGSSITDCE